MMQKRRWILYGVAAIFLLLLTGSGHLLLQKHHFKQSIAAIPEFCLPQAADSALFCKAQLLPDKPVALLYFHPECEICQREAQQMHEKSAFLKDIQWVLVSPAPRDTLRQFARMYHLAEIPDINILMDVKGDLSTLLQVKSMPACYIYNRKHHLVKTMQGLVRLETVMQLTK
jgi:peroxiredoxin